MPAAEFADRFLTKSVIHSEPPQWRKRPPPRLDYIRLIERCNFIQLGHLRLRGKIYR